MAVAGLHNIPAFGSSFFIESQSSVLRQQSEQDTPRTRASSVLQMWRKLEDELVVSNSNSRNGENFMGTLVPDGQGIANHNRCVRASEAQNRSVTSESQMELENEFEDGHSVSSDQSSDLGEIERERVRQIFQEWRNTGVKSHSQSLNLSNVNKWLGENERKKVGIVRDWAQMSIQHSGTPSPRDAVASGIGPQSEQVRDGSLVNHLLSGERKVALRRLCGRQALVDLLMRSQRERKKELQCLLECKPVSDFAYRNRIQSLLRGRFLLNKRLPSDERVASNAASELGLLRQRHAVSDLREELLSRLDNNDRGSTNDLQSEASTHNDPEHSQLNNEEEVIDDFYDQPELVDEESDADASHVIRNLESTIYEHVNQKSSVNQVAESSEQVGGNEDREQENTNFEIFGCGPETEDNGNRNLVGNAGDGQETAVIGGSLQGFVQEEDHEIFHDDNASRSESSDTHEVADGDFGDLERNIFEDYDWHGSLTQAEEPLEFVAEHEESFLQQSEEHEESDSQQLYADEYNEWEDDATENTGGSWEEGTTNQWFPESVEHDIEEQSHAQEPHDEWHGNVLEEAIDDWLDMPSDQDDGSTGRVDTFYIPDDDNVYSIEIRELLSRRRVSSLLRSGFRENLDQLIQSYVERQGHTALDWDMDVEQGQQLENDDHDGTVINIERNPFAIAPPQDAPSQPLGDQERHQRIGGSEWDIINELRIDMAGLQQRMSNMQRMLETCMEMQGELQRSVRQEVSAALNQCASTDVDVCEDSLLNDESNWDKVRRGICCLCSTSNIDSLLYRCGHMCTCLKCAETLVQGKAKCPMCRAPVLEAIRAFSTQ